MACPGSFPSCLGKNHPNPKLGRVRSNGTYAIIATIKYISEVLDQKSRHWV